VLVAGILGERWATVPFPEKLAIFLGSWQKERVIQMQQVLAYLEAKLLT